MVTMANGHQTFYYTLMNTYVIHTKLPSPHPRKVFLGKIRSWDLDTISSPGSLDYELHLFEEAIWSFGESVSSSVMCRKF